MQEYFSILKKNILFKDIAEDKLSAALADVHAYIRHYEKNEIIRDYNREVTGLGIVLKGNCHAVRIDINGNRHILRDMTAGANFGESLAFSNLKKSPVSIVSASQSTVLFIPVKKNFAESISSPENHSKIMENLITLLAVTSVMLQVKNDILSKRSIREKLLTYLGYKSEQSGSRTFKILFSREELADYLGVNRTALQRELSKMRREGILTFEKKTFVLKSNPLQ